MTAGHRHPLSIGSPAVLLAVAVVVSVGSLADASAIATATALPPVQGTSTSSTDRESLTRLFDKLSQAARTVRSSFASFQTPSWQIGLPAAAVHQAAVISTNLTAPADSPVRWTDIALALPLPLSRDCIARLIDLPPPAPVL